MKFTIYEAETGRVLFSGAAHDPALLAQAGQRVLEGEAFAAGWIDPAEAHHAQPERPGPHHEFDWAAKRWVDPRTLADLRAETVADLKRWRAAARFAPLLKTRFGVFQADAAGVAALVEKAAMVQAAGGVASVVWTLADNAAVSLAPAELNEVVALLLARDEAAQERARALRVRVVKATSAAQLQKITWD